MENITENQLTIITNNVELSGDYLQGNSIVNKIY